MSELPHIWDLIKFAESQNIKRYKISYLLGESDLIDVVLAVPFTPSIDLKRAWDGVVRQERSLHIGSIRKLGLFEARVAKKSYSEIYQGREQLFRLITPFDIKATLAPKTQAMLVEK